MKLFLASGNAHKRLEFARIFPDHDIVIPTDLGLAFDPDETESTFHGNALIKAKALFALTGGPVIADDSGICVDALGGEPGIRSARYGSEGGVNLDAAGRNRLLLENMRGMSDRRARFVCNLVLYLGPDRYWSVQETLEGLIIEDERGTGGFGYDPVMFIPEEGMTVAELSDADKDRLSHRGKAGRLISLLLDAL